MARKKELPPGLEKKETKAAQPDARGKTQAWWQAVLTRRNELAAVVLFAAILVLRAPWVLISGRFWGEEAPMFFGYARSHSFFDALIATHAGYYNFVANFGGILASWFPLEWAPRATTTFALFIYILPAGLILFGTLPGLVTPLRKAAALALLLVVPANPELYLISINCHFLLCATTGLVLISPHGTRMGHLGKYLILGLAGLTGVVSTFLAPLFWWQWWRERRRERLVQASLLSLCALIQVIAIGRGMEQGERQFRVSLPVITGAAYAKLIAGPLAPKQSATHQMLQIQQTMAQGGSLPDWVWLATAGGLGGLLLVCWASRRPAALLLVAACLWITLLASPGSREARSEQTLLIHLVGADRYYYAPQFFLFLALLIAIGPETRLPSPWRALSALWLGAALAMGAINFIRGPLDTPQFFMGPSWSNQVAQWRKDPSQPLAVWPPPWHLNLPVQPGPDAATNPPPPEPHN